MASERFLKLTPEKQKRILDAARQEFSSVPYEEVSINQIIKNAQISRGSFYTYFEDKNDVLTYILEDQENSSMQSMKDVLQEVKGNYWLFLTTWLERMLSFQHSKIVQESVGIFRNSGLHTLGAHFGTFDQKCETNTNKNQREKTLDDWFYEHVDPETVDLGREREEVNVMFHMTRFMAFMTLLHMLITDQEDEALRVKRQFYYYVRTMKVGAAPRE